MTLIESLIFQRIFMLNDDDDDNVELLHFRKADAMKQELLAIRWDDFNNGALVDDEFDDEDPSLAEVQVVEKVDNKDVAADDAAAALYEEGFGVDVKMRTAAFVPQF